MNKNKVKSNNEKLMESQGKMNVEKTNKKKVSWNNILVSEELFQVLNNAKSCEIVHDIETLKNMSAPIEGNEFFSVEFDLPDGKKAKEVYVANVKNGICANYSDSYMRRRDPETMLIGDDKPTDKKKYKDEYGKHFNELRGETLEWLKKQDILVIPFIAGNSQYGAPSIALIPKNAAFFAFGLGLLQGTVDISKFKNEFIPKCFLFLAPPFRQTHFNGKQRVVHNRLDDAYEIFSYNLYPGPSAKKGVYGALIYFGELENWLTNHCSVVRVTTPYGNKVTIMHEGASGGGKSEMNQHIKREIDGSILLGSNTLTNEKEHIVLPRGCIISPVVDDMGSCYPELQKDNGKIGVIDAEDGWFIRVNHITNYGTDQDIESLTIHPKLPLLFLNIDAQPGSTALLWEHIMDSECDPCPNPRVVVPKEYMPSVVKKPVYVDIRSFGIRTPPCTMKKPTYGIVGLFHIIPPAIAWIWRLVSPRGFANPSIIDTEGMSSEGVGSYWPFATGKKVVQANMLLKQIIDNPEVHYVLCPVGNVGAWNVGFIPEWIMREYFSRRGGVKFMPEDLLKSKSTLLGYSLNKVTIEGQTIPEGFLKPELQPEVGLEAHSKGCKILDDYFKKELAKFMTDELDPLGKKIIQLFLDNADLEEFEKLISGSSILMED